jgi:hypothetical protein
LDPLAAAVDAASIVVLLAVILIGVYAIRNFKKSKQALTESASLISVIVDALTSRIQESESAVSMVRTEIGGLETRNAGLESEQAALQTSHLQLLRSLQEALSNDKRMIAELESLKRRFTSSPPGRNQTEPQPKPMQLGVVVGRDEILTALTPTEHETLDILLHEGPKPAPELGRRVNKSREHTSRLMKKLYLEGYVDRESNHAPFRYKLNESVRSALQLNTGPVTAEAPEKA